MIELMGRRDFLGFMSATTAGLLVPRWVFGKFERFGESSPGARVALESDTGELIAAKTAAYRVIGDFPRFVAHLTEDLCWPHDSFERDCVLRRIWMVIPEGKFCVWDGNVFLDASSSLTLWPNAWEEM